MVREYAERLYEPAADAAERATAQGYARAKGVAEWKARVEAVGRVVPRIDGHAAIAAPQPGRISAVPGKPLPFLGDKVKKGQPLFVIEQTLGASESGATADEEPKTTANEPLSQRAENQPLSKPMLSAEKGARVRLV